LALTECISVWEARAPEGPQREVESVRLVLSNKLKYSEIDSYTVALQYKFWKQPGRAYKGKEELGPRILVKD